MATIEKLQQRLKRIAEIVELADQRMYRLAKGTKPGSYSCPHCKKYILVGEHWIRKDERRTKERAAAIERAAREL